MLSRPKTLLINSYYQLAKPGIVWGNALTALAGFLFAANGEINFPKLIAMLVGLSLIIAGSCVVNNIIDRDIDAKMERTRNRAMPAGTISIRAAYIYAAMLGSIGSTLLYCFTNSLTLGVALFGVFVYVACYTPLKRVNQHATLVGSLAGAVPPVVGYTAVSNSLDATALILFIILIAWQMVHFFAIAIYRIDEYRAAGVPVFPITQGITRTKGLMTIYVVIFGGASLVLPLVAAFSTPYFLVLSLISFVWLGFAVWGFKARDDRRWARLMFFYSLIALMVLSLMLAAR